VLDAKGEMQNVLTNLFGMNVRRREKSHQNTKGLKETQEAGTWKKQQAVAGSTNQEARIRKQEAGSRKKTILFEKCVS
jgi:hypothetical protein